MGVFGLEKFLESEELGEQTNLGDLIKVRKSETNETPIVVIDGSSCSPTFGRDPSNWLFGGQLRQIFRRMTRFIDKVHDFGGKVVAFYDGTVDKSKLDVWIKKRMDKQKQIQKFFNVDASLPQFPNSALYTITKNAFLFKGCTVYNTIKNSDEEISQFAKENNCLALLAHNTNYLIFPNADFYFTVNYFNFETFDGIAFTRNKLARHLGISTRLLPVFASLAGNEIVKRGDLNHLHTAQTFNQFGHFFFNVANYVEQLPLLEYDTLDYFHENESTYGSELIVDKIITSINTYEQKNGVLAKVNENTEWDCFLNILLDKHHYAAVPSYLLSLVFDKHYHTCNDLEDLTNSKICISDALKPLRQRIYGILHSNSPSVEKFEKIFVREWCVHNRNFPDNLPEEVEAVLPEKAINLYRLWSDDADDQNKWELFCKTINSKLTVESMKNLPSHLVFPVCALYYLKYELDCPFFEECEIRALVNQAVRVSWTDLKVIKRARIAFKDKRAVEIASQFLRAISVIELLNATCGNLIKLEDACPSKYFDGRLFHSAYFDFKNDHLESFCDLEFEMNEILGLDVPRLVDD